MRVKEAVLLAVREVFLHSDWLLLFLVCRAEKQREVDFECLIVRKRDKRALLFYTPIFFQYFTIYLLSFDVNLNQIFDIQKRFFQYLFAKDTHPQEKASFSHCISTRCEVVHSNNEQVPIQEEFI